MILEKLTGKGLIIHHWDTDGICSATLLLKHLVNKKIDNKTPVLGNYYLTREELDECKKYDFIIIADMSLPKNNILTLRENSETIIFDHHLGEEIKEVFHHNPIIKGEKPEEYPSASWIINQYLKNNENLFALLGIVGDHEEKIKNNKKFFLKINNFCKKNNITFEDLLEMVYLIDSNYKIGDKKAVEQAPHILKEIKHPVEILEEKQWNKKHLLLEEEIQKHLSEKPETLNDLILKKINTKYNIISTLTRKIAWENKRNTIVINTGFFEKQDQIYVRSNNRNLQPLISEGKKLGFKCGGKKEVLGAITPKEKTDEFVDKIINFLI